MKKAISILLFAVLTCVFFSLPRPVRAAEKKYVVIGDSETYLYSSSDLSDENRIFILPKTYYAEVTNEGEDYYAVKYMENRDGLLPVSGFVKKDKVVIKTPEVKPFYFSVHLEKKGSPAIYESPDLSSEVETVILSGTVLYYGEYAIRGESWFFVSCQGTFGYALKKDFAEITVPNHPDYVEPEPEPLPDDNPTGDQTIIKDGTSTADGTIQIILIVLICIPAVALVFTLFKKSKNGGS